MASVQKTPFPATAIPPSFPENESGDEGSREKSAALSSPTSAERTSTAGLGMGNTVKTKLHEATQPLSLRNKRKQADGDAGEQPAKSLRMSETDPEHGNWQDKNATGDGPSIGQTASSMDADARMNVAAQWDDMRMAMVGKTRFAVPEWKALSEEHKILYERAATGLPQDIDAQTPDALQAFRSSKMAESFNDIIKETALNDAMKLNWEQAYGRHQAFFGKKSSAEEEAGLASSGSRIDAYLKIRDNAGFPPAPAEVRQLMVQFDRAMRDLHQAIPFGRGNVIVRKGDANLAPEASASVGPAEFDFERMAAKDTLAILAMRIAKRLTRQHGGDSKRVAASEAAAALLTGAAGCDEYASLLAFRVASICSQLRSQFARVELIATSGPTVPIPGTSQSTPIGHTSLVLELRTMDGKEFSILMEPWDEANLPVLQEHIAFREPSGRLNAPPLFRDDCSSSTGLSPDISPQTILRDMKAAAEFLPEEIKSPKLLDWFRRHKERMQQIAHDRAYSLLKPAKGGFVDRSGTMVTSRLRNPPRRRPSLIPAETSTVVRWIVAAVG